jgi:hypothetical protein
MEFEWDPEKNEANIETHGVSFEKATRAWLDPRRFVVRDKKHSSKEDRFFLFGRVEGEVLTVRFTRRGARVRIIGAGYWREGRYRYAQKNTER